MATPGCYASEPMADEWTVRRVLSWTAQDFADRGLDAPRLDAELLVARALGVGRVALYLDLDRPLGPEELQGIRQLVARRRAREPMAYILGEREFWGRSFECGPGTLVPRPETETLVARALDVLPADAAGPVVDLCTGTGAVGLTLLAERPALRGELTDLAEEALETTRRNAARLGVEGRLRVHRGDLFRALPERVRVPLVVANPPYVADAEVSRLMPEVSRHEPHLALAGGPDGLDVVRRILEEAGAWLTPDGALLLEIGADQGERIAELGPTLPPERDLAFDQVYPDLGGAPRVAAFRSTVTPETLAAEEAAARASEDDQTAEGDGASASGDPVADG